MLRKLPVIVAPLLLIVISLEAQRPARTRLERSAMIRRAMDATVSLRVKRGSDSAQGSGFFVAPIGILVTAAHVVDGASFIEVFRSSGITNDVAGVYLIDRDRDFALLKVDVANAPVVRIGNSDSLTIGERVMAIGSPLGLEATVSDGLISADRSDEDTRLLQISVPVSPGSSGGPVLAQDGRVVGVVVAGIRGGGAENLNFALPINYVRPALLNAATTEPVAVSDAITVTQGRRRADLIRQAESRSTEVIAQVNDSIAFDWKALDGVSAYVVDNDHTRTLRVTTNYRMTTDVNGSAVLERHQTGIWNQGYEDRFVDERRVLLDDHRNIHEYFERRSNYPDLFQSGSWESSLREGQWRINSDFRGSSSAKLPAGALPMAFEVAAVAALPDSLPASIHIWFVTWDTSFVARVTPIRFDFGERAQIEVSVSTHGEPCGPRTQVVKRKFPVVWVTETDGATRTTFPVLATRPHLRVDAANRQCIWWRQSSTPP